MLSSNAHAPCYIICGLSGSTILSTLIKGTIFRKKVIEHKMCVMIFSTTFAWTFLFLKKIPRDFFNKPTQVFMYSMRYSCQILRKLAFPKQIFEKKKAQIRNFIKIRSSGRCSMLTDRQIKMTKLTVAFRNISNASQKNCSPPPQKKWAIQPMLYSTQ